MRVVACYSQGMCLLKEIFFYETHNKEIHRNTKHLMGKPRQRGCDYSLFIYCFDQKHATEIVMSSSCCCISLR